MTFVVIEAIPLLLYAIREIIESKPDYQIIRQSGDLHGLNEILQEINPDVLWLDSIMLEASEEGTLPRIHRKFPNVKILLFGVEENVPVIRKYFKQGIFAYLPKTADAEEIGLALNCLELGELYIPPSLNQTFTSWLTDPVRKKKPGCKLTQREQEVLHLIVEEYTTLEIARQLYISQCTVETHRINLIQKLGVKNVAGLVREAIQRQLYLC